MPLSESERYPLMTDAGRSLLRDLHEHPSAPLFNHHVGDRMDQESLQRARDFQNEVFERPPQWRDRQPPEWLQPFVNYCERETPFYRRRAVNHGTFTDIPTTCRADFGQAPWMFVPDDQPVDDLILYNTSGTTGHPIDILSRPIVSTMVVPLLRAALRTRGVELNGGAGRVAVAQICFQKRTFTFAALSSILGEAGNLKLNLNPLDWRDPDDRIRYLDEWAPEILTGDPISFYELTKLPLRRQPKALISTSMTLLPGLQKTLEDRFGCPALDLYSMNETGPIAVRLPGEDQRYQLLQPRLYVEILDNDGNPCQAGERGEITVTGGFNPLLPLLRYRTGDYGTLAYYEDAKTPFLSNVEGRPATVFRGASGQHINNIDVTQVMRRYPIARFALHQSSDGSLQLRVSDNGTPDEELLIALRALFGVEQVITISLVDIYEGKLVQYTTDLG